MSDGCTCYATGKCGGVLNMRHYNRRLSRGRAYTRAETQYNKKKKSFSFQGLTFARIGINCLWISAPLPTESRFQAHFQRLFQQKYVKPSQVFIYSFCSWRWNASTGRSYFRVLPGAFLSVSGAGSWRDLYVHAWAMFGYLCLESLPCIEMHPFFEVHYVCVR